LVKINREYNEPKHDIVVYIINIVISKWHGADIGKDPFTLWSDVETHGRLYSQGYTTLRNTLQ